MKANYRKLNDRSHNSSTYHKKDGTPVRAILKQELAKEVATVDTERWAVTYLHDWDPDGKIYPEVHAIYNTFQEAETVRKAMSDPSKYWVRRARIG